MQKLCSNQFRISDSNFFIRLIYTTICSKIGRYKSWTKLNGYWVKQLLILIEISRIEDKLYYTSNDYNISYLLANQTVFFKKTFRILNIQYFYIVSIHFYLIK